MLFTQQFAAIVATYPDYVAVLSDGKGALSYKQLLSDAQNIAGYLQAQNFGAEDIIALAMPKSAGYITAMLGCWFAGCAFMPLDPNLPPPRRAFIVDEAAPKCILTAEMLQQIRREQYDYQPVSIVPDQLAYVIYTSGSTGQPKGVMVTHRGIVPMLQQQIATFAVSAHSRCLFYLSTNFDASISDIGTTLLAGATLIIESTSAIDNAANMPKLLAARGITHMDIPPSLLRLLSPDDMPATLQTIIIGGEACAMETVRQWASRFRLVNVYGPTEATICTSMVVCDASAWSRPLIGNVMEGVTYLLLDDAQNIIDGAGTGELYIGGQQLARGYLKRDELSAAKFVTLRGQRLYRTGDLITRHDNGDLEFIGRVDRQVKMRGQLVELEEIEAQILLQKSIARAAVLKNNIAGRDALVAYIQPKPAAKIMPEQIKLQLRSSLPSWMIPQYVCVRDQLPLTNTGKIDFAALRLLPVNTQDGQSTHAPETEIEQAVHALWCRVLKGRDIGIDDNFFALGGDSMAVLELSMEAELQGFSLTPAIIVALPSIAEQAAFLSGATTLIDNAVSAGGMQAEILRRDVTFDDEFATLLEDAKRRSTTKKTMQHVLITGATGFLGTRLLRELLYLQPQAILYPLVRAKDLAAAELRMQQLLGTAFDASRIKPICGDIGLPQLGLSDTDWAHYTTLIDTIFHNGAVVNMVQSYEALRAANVEATQTALRFALTGQCKHLHYSSTLSVFVATNQNTGRVVETDNLGNVTHVYGGYAQTKWAAEYMLLQVPPSACDISIYRLGLVTGDTQSGTCSSHDFIAMFVLGLINLGSVPQADFAEMEVDVTPVDYAAQVMASLASSPHNNGVFHIANQRGFNLAQIIAQLQARGIALRQLPLDAWQAEMRARSAGFTPNEAATYLALCRCFTPQGYDTNRVMDLFQASHITFDTTRTTAALRASGGNIECPKADDKLLSLYFDVILGQMDKAA